MGGAKKNAKDASKKKGILKTPAKNEETKADNGSAKSENDENHKEKSVNFNTPTGNGNSSQGDQATSGDSAAGWLSEYWFLIVAVLLVVMAVLYQCEVNGETVIATKTAVIKGSRDELFEFVANYQNYNRWFPSHYYIVEENQMPIGMGKSYLTTDRYPLIGDSTYDVKVISYEAPNIIIFNADHWTKTKVEIRLKPYKDRADLTTVTWTMTSRMSSYLAHGTVCPLLKVIYAGRSRQGLFNLRTLFRPDEL